MDKKRQTIYSPTLRVYKYVHRPTYMSRHMELHQSLAWTCALCLNIRVSWLLSCFELLFLLSMINSHEYEYLETIRMYWTSQWLMQFHPLRHACGLWTKPGMYPTLVHVISDMLLNHDILIQTDFQKTTLSEKDYVANANVQKAAI